jgi:AraC-like DNA-binding protein
LRKIFSDQIGISPTQYRLKEKLNQAKYLLESTDMSVGEISDNLNFYDTAYFCKLFHKQMGLSPKQYRQNKML